MMNDLTKIDDEIQKNAQFLDITIDPKEEIKTVLMIGPDMDSSPFPQREFLDFFRHYGKPITQPNRNVLKFENGIELRYKSYKSAFRGFHPDMIIIVNIYLFDDIRLWWRVLMEEIMPMVMPRTLVRYWRW